jgi:serine/threonine protein kinase
MENIIGSPINKYKMINIIGMGKFGKIMEGINCRTNEKVAIKIENVNSPVNILKHETTILNYLFRHGCKNIPLIRWFGLDTENVYFVMPLYVPISIEYWKSNEMQIMHKMIEIFEFIHEKYVIHRDIKPQNIMLYNKNIILIDFGLSTIFFDEFGEHGANKGPNQHIIGTPNYISLFIHEGNTPSRRDDLISLGYIYSFYRGEINWLYSDLKKSTEIVDRSHILYHENQDKKHKKIEYFQKTDNTIIRRYFNYCYHLSYVDKPNYDGLQKLFIF